MVQLQPAAPKICTPMKIPGSAINASSCDRSRTMRRRSLVAAVGSRACAGGTGVVSAQTAPASSHPAMPARRANTITISSVAPTDAASAISPTTARNGSPRASAASGAPASVAGDSDTIDATAATPVASAWGARIT